MFHRFGPAGSCRRATVAQFEQQVRYLKQNANVVSMSRFGGMLKSGEPLPDNTAVITIDDGYADFHEYAFPILRRYDVPATFYVTSGFVDRTVWQWPDLVMYILRNARERHWCLRLQQRDRQFELSESGDNRPVWLEICQHAMKLKDVEKNRFLRELAEQAKVSVPAEPTAEFAPASWDQLREMSAAGIEVAGHTITHPRLVCLAEDRLAEEIAGCKARIEEMLDSPVYSFAYPHGNKEDYSKKIKEVVAQAGYATAVAAFPISGTHDHYELGRFAIDNDREKLADVISGAELVMWRANKMLGIRG